MRIGLISQEYPPETAKGGIGTQTYLKAHGLTGLGHHVRVISRSVTYQRTEIDDNGVRVIRVPSAQMSVHTELADWIIHSYGIAEEISRQHANEAFDILDFPEWACEGYIHLLNRSEWNRIPTVVHLHGPLIMLARTLGWPEPESEFFRIGTQMEATTLRMADAVFSSSSCSADWCASEYGLEREKIPVIHAGIDTELFYPRPVTKAAVPTIAFVGKMVRNKGVEILVDAVCEVAKEFPGLRLRMMGGGEESIITSIKKMLAERGMDRVLDLPGYVDRVDLPDHLSSAHIFAAPSRYEGGPGFVYLEAMACGLPVIGCSGSGSEEVIRHGYNGLLVEPDDRSGLIDALRRLLGNVEQREAMSRNAVAFVRENAESKNLLRELSEFYRRVLDGFHGN